MLQGWKIICVSYLLPGPLLQIWKGTETYLFMFLGTILWAPVLFAGLIIHSFAFAVHMSSPCNLYSIEETFPIVLFVVCAGTPAYAVTA